MKQLIFLLFLIPLLGFSQNKKTLIATVNRLKSDSTILHDKLKIKSEEINNKNILNENLKKNLKTVNQDLLELVKEYNISKNKNIKLQKLNDDLNLTNDVLYDTINLLIKENDSLKQDSKFKVHYNLKFNKISEEGCDSIFLVDFYINNKFIFSDTDEITADYGKHGEQILKGGFLSLEFSWCEMVNNEPIEEEVDGAGGYFGYLSYNFLKLNKDVFLVYKELTTNIEVP